MFNLLNLASRYTGIYYFHSFSIYFKYFIIKGKPHLDYFNYFKSSLNYIQTTLIRPKARFSTHHFFNLVLFKVMEVMLQGYINWKERMLRLNPQSKTY